MSRRRKLRPGSCDHPHPDRRLRLAPNPILNRLRSNAVLRTGDIRRNDIELVLTLAAVFFAIHIGRMPTADTWLGIVSPFVATAGDFLMTLAVAAFLFLPVRLLWRRLTRPVERLAWSLRVAAAEGTAPMNCLVAWPIGQWLDWRFLFAVRLRAARTSLFAALLLILRIGLPVTAFFVAINPIWGFTWYFNTESWASRTYQKMTQLRVDPWRLAMIDAVARAYGGAVDDLVRIRPVNVADIGTAGSGRSAAFRRPVREHLRQGLESRRGNPISRLEVDA